MASKKTPVYKAAIPVRRYEIHLLNLDPTAGREVRESRPCVVVSPDPMHGSGLSVDHLAAPGMGAPSPSHLRLKAS